MTEGRSYLQSYYRKTIIFSVSEQNKFLYTLRTGPALLKEKKKTWPYQITDEEQLGLNGGSTLKIAANILNKLIVPEHISRDLVVLRNISGLGLLRE